MQVVELYLDSSDGSATESTQMSLLVKTVAKRASPTVLLPALCGMWEKTIANVAKVCIIHDHPTGSICSRQFVQDDSKKVLSFLQVVKVSVKAASRPAVLENLRDLFKTFLSMFGLCAEQPNTEVRSVHDANCSRVLTSA